MARIGPHVTKTHASGKSATFLDNIRAAFAEAEGEGFTPRAASIFVMGPRDRTMRVSAAEAEDLKAYVKQTGIALVPHSAYVNSNPWRGDPTAAKAIRDELRVCHESGAAGLVVHLPIGPHEWVLRFLPRLVTGFTSAAQPAASQSAAAQTAAAASHSAQQSAPRIYLEHVAAKPEKSYYETPEKIGALFKQIRTRLDPNLSKFGFCIDTAHVWASGVDISSYADAEAWLNDLEAIRAVLPPDKIMLHLNDNCYSRGAGRDEHAPLLEGEIWSKYREVPEKSGLAAFLDYARRNSTVVILERKPPSKLLSDYRNILRLQAMDLKAGKS